MRIITLEKTCDMCPEQYWAHSGAKTIGYIRLRWGRLTCDYLPTGRPKLADNNIRVLEHLFRDKNDEYKGCFNTEEERKEWLDKCKAALMKEYLKHKNRRTKICQVD